MGRVGVDGGEGDGAPTGGEWARAGGGDGVFWGNAGRKLGAPGRKRTRSQGNGRLWATPAGSGGHWAMLGAEGGVRASPWGKGAGGASWGGSGGGTGARRWGYRTVPGRWGGYGAASVVSLSRGAPPAQLHGDAGTPRSRRSEVRAAPGERGPSRAPSGVTRRQALGLPRRFRDSFPFLITFPTRNQPGGAARQPGGCGWAGGALPPEQPPGRAVTPFPRGLAPCWPPRRAVITGRGVDAAGTGSPRAPSRPPRPRARPGGHQARPLIAADAKPTGPAGSRHRPAAGSGGKHPVLGGVGWLRGLIFRPDGSSRGGGARPWPGLLRGISRRVQRGPMGRFLEEPQEAVGTPHGRCWGGGRGGFPDTLAGMEDLGASRGARWGRRQTRATRGAWLEAGWAPQTPRTPREGIPARHLHRLCRPDRSHQQRGSRTPLVAQICRGIP